jgi:prolyl oligopeptidase
MSSERSDTAFLKFSSFLHPTSIYRIDVRQKKIDVFQSNPAEFAADRFQVEARQAVSKDGVRVPYVLVMPKSRPKDGLTPVLVEGYGASGVPVESPEYSGTLGKLWLERGAAFAIADVRGGRGHAAGWWVRGAARRHTYEDMAAVVEDLIRTGITSPKRVGIKGHSSGGLLAAAMMTQRPDLFGAVVLEAALLDQFRMDLVMGGQGAFDMDFGSLAVDSERKFLERTSPFQNLNCSPALPKPFIITSATDQTVLPAQSRRFAAKLETGGCPFLFLETEEGGHSLALTPQERARLDALIYTYLARQLMDPAVPRTTRNEFPTR